MYIGKIVFTLLFYISYSFCLSEMLTVNQNGDYDFLTIQDAIDFSVNEDTILVYPGEYFENCIIENKNLTISSLFIHDLDDQYVNQTIINGNNESSCFAILSSDVKMSGFSITNGSGYQFMSNEFRKWGGGLYVNESSLIIEKCKIRNNTALYGGGINAIESDVNFVSCSIYQNQSYKGGGGLCSINSMFHFDEILLSNIYSNYSAKGMDILYKNENSFLNVVVDTFTVNNPTVYNIASTNNLDQLLDNVTISMENHKIEQVNQNLYVSPDGDNNNSGLSIDAPIKNIHYALNKIVSDSMNTNNIYIKSGEYSLSNNNELFPLQLKGYVSLIGENKESTIFNAEEITYHMLGRYSSFEYSIEEISLFNGNTEDMEKGSASSINLSGELQDNPSVVLNNLIIKNNVSENNTIALSNISSIVSNVEINNNIGRDAIFFLSNYDREESLSIRNCKIVDNESKGISLIGSPYIEHQNKILITNSIISDNTSYNVDFPQNGISIFTDYNLAIDIINCSIVNNTWDSYYGSSFYFGGRNIDINIYNTIMYGNYFREIIVSSESTDYPIELNIYSSLLDRGIDYITNIGDIGIIDSYNLIDQNPQFLEDYEYPYFLSSSSPCIDSGTLGLPDNIMIQDTDLIGNPRIYGETIDIGAYEWDGTLNNEVMHEVNINGVNVYPNPFVCNSNSKDPLTIEFSSKSTDFVEIYIYNLKGQKAIALKIEDIIIRKNKISIGSSTFSKLNTGYYFFVIHQEGKSFVKRILIIR